MGGTPAICYKGTGAGLFFPSPSPPSPLHFFLLLLFYRFSLRRPRSPALSTDAVPLLYAPFSIFLLFFSSFSNSPFFSFSSQPSFFYFFFPTHRPRPHPRPRPHAHAHLMFVVIVRETTLGHERGSTRVCVRSRRSAGESLTAGHSPPVLCLPFM